MTSDVTWHDHLDRAERWGRLGVAGATVWFTGLPGSGKSTLAAAVEAALVGGGRPAYLVDGDNLRHGLTRDLGFGDSDRRENVRRAGEVARILADAGTVALVSLVSPFRAGRAEVRRLHDQMGLPFHEVWVSTPLAECERRDPKGLYDRARRGVLRGLTGVDADYEPPERPDLELPTHQLPIDDCVAAVLRLLD